MSTESKVSLSTASRVLQPQAPAHGFIQRQGQVFGRPGVEIVYQPINEAETRGVSGHRSNEFNSRNRSHINRSQENIRETTILRDFRNEWNIEKEKTSSMSNIIHIIAVFYLAEKIIPFVGNIFGTTFLVIFLLLTGAVVFLKYKETLSGIVQKGRDLFPTWSSIKDFFSVGAEDRNTLGNLASARV